MRGQNSVAVKTVISLKPAQKSVKAGICGICPAGCGVNVHFKKDKIERLSPHKNHPAGIVCPRGMKSTEIVYSPLDHRIRQTSVPFVLWLMG